MVSMGLVLTKILTMEVLQPIAISICSKEDLCEWEFFINSSSIYIEVI